MKLFHLLIIILNIFLFACKSKQKIANTQKKSTEITTTINKDSTTTKRNIFTIKIIRKTCASIVVQIMDEKYFYLGEQWTPANVRMKEPYKNVLSINNICDWSNNCTENVLYNVLLLDKNTSLNCVVCAMMDFPPIKTASLKLLSSNITNMKSSF